MAKTYYKYAEKQADSQVNWFQVGKDLTDMLKKETEIRDQKKAAIDEASRQFGQELENAPQGNSDDVNQWTTNYAADMQQYRLMTDKLLKSGQLKVKDYTLIRQNTMDGTKNLFNLAKEYQAEFEEKTRRRDEDKSSASEGQFLAMVEGFANLNQTKALINPTTGAISVGKMEKGPDGVLRLKEGTDNYMTVNSLRNRIKEKIDKYQLNDALAGEVKLMGEVINEVETATSSILKGGMLTKFTDPTLRKGLSQEGQQAVNTYINLENKIVQSKLSNPRHVSSILFDWSGGIDPKTNKPYQVVTDEKLAATSSHYVLWTYKDGIFQPDFESTSNGKEQYKQAEEYTKKKLRGMLEQKTEMRPTPQAQLQEYRAKSEGEIDAEKKEAEAQNMGKMLAYAVSGNASQKRQAGDYFKAIKGLSGIEYTDKGINVLEGATSLPYAYTTGGIETNSETLGRSMIKALNRSELPEDVIIRAMKANLVSPKVSKFAIGRVGREATDYATEMGGYARKNVSTGVTFNNPAKTKTNLEAKFKGLGFTFVGGSRGGTFGIGKDDYIAITAPNGKTQEFIIDDGSNNTAIANFINDNRDDRIIERSGLFGNKTSGSTTPTNTTQPKVNYGDK